MRVCSQLVDSHLYLLKKWVIDYLKKNKYVYTLCFALYDRYMYMSVNYPVLITGASLQ